MKDKLAELIAKAEQALADGDAEAAEKYTNEATEVKTLLEAQERLAEVKAAELKRQETERQAAAEQAEAELKARIDEAVAEAVKQVQIDRPDYTESGNDSEDEVTIPKIIQLRAATSRYDRLGTLDLATRYYLKSRAARLGLTSPPSERMLGALTHRAARFMKEEDELPYLDRWGGVKSVKVPAFDPVAVTPWTSEEGTEKVFIPGYGNVSHGDNVTPDGIKSLMRIAVKANEVVYSTQASYGDELGISSLMA